MSTEQYRYPPLLVDDSEDIGPPRGVWMLLLAIILAKIVVVGAVLTVEFTWTSSVFLFVTTWFWIIAGVAVFAGPAIFAFRLRKVRSRRDQLQRSEWVVEESG